MKSVENIPDFEKEALLLQLSQKTGKKVIRFESESRFSRITPTFAKIRLLVRDKMEEQRKLESIGTHSTFFGKFTDVIVTHYYIDPLSE